MFDLRKEREIDKRVSEPKSRASPNSYHHYTGRSKKYLSHQRSNAHRPSTHNWRKLCTFFCVCVSFCFLFLLFLFNFITDFCSHFDCCTALWGRAYKNNTIQKKNGIVFFFVVVVVVVCRFSPRFSSSIRIKS